MGLVFDEVTFEGSAPNLARISDKVAELSGLPVSVTQRLQEEDKLSAMLGELAFEGAPKNTIELRAYHPGAVKKWADEEDGGMVIPEARAGHLEGYGELPGTQTVYIRSHYEQEPTLLLFILRALQELGGQLEHPLSEESRALCDKPVSAAELDRREQKAARNALTTLLVGALFIPLSLLAIPFSILFLPFKLTRSKMNQAVELSHKASRERGKPDYIGRLKYAFMMLWVLPFWLFMAIAAIVGAVVLIPCIPFYLAYRGVVYFGERLAARVSG